MGTKCVHTHTHTLMCFQQPTSALCDQTVDFPVKPASNESQHIIVLGVFLSLKENFFYFDLLNSTHSAESDVCFILFFSGKHSVYHRVKPSFPRLFETNWNMKVTFSPNTP